MRGVNDTEEPTIRRSPLEVIIDTDIGTDVDDAYAILLALSSPELNLRGLTLVHANLETRLKITAKLLKLADRTDVPVALGETHTMNRERPLTWLGNEGRGIDFSDVEGFQPVGEHAAEFIARTASEKPGEVTLITIGPLTNAGILLRDFPREAAMLRGIVTMGSTFNGFGPENAGREHNAAVDPEATMMLLESGIPLLLVGWNVTIQTSLVRERMAEIAALNTPMSRLIVTMTEDWLQMCKRDNTAMHDPLAVAAAFDSGVVGTISVTPEIRMESPESVIYHPAGDESPIRICNTVDVTRFEGLFFPRIMRAMERF